MIDCRYKMNKKKKTCKDKKKPKTKKQKTKKIYKKKQKTKKIYKKKQTQKKKGMKQSQSLTVHVHTKTKTRTRTKIRSGNPYLKINHKQKSYNDFLIQRLRDDLKAQRNTLDELKQFNIMKYGENIALKKNIALMEQDQIDLIQNAKQIIKQKEVQAEERGERRGYEKQKQEQKEKKKEANRKYREKVKVREKEIKNN